MSPIELYEHRRHLTAAIHDLEKRIPTMDEVTRQRPTRPSTTSNANTPEPSRWRHTAPANDRVLPHDLGARSVRVPAVQTAIQITALLRKEQPWPPTTTKSTHTPHKHCAI